MDKDEIKELRNGYKESQSDFGKRFGVSGRTVRRWETGRTSPLPAFRMQLEKLWGEMK